MADVAPQFHHERLAKSHDFAVGLPFGIKVRAAFTAAHGETGQRILENLFEREKLENGHVHAGVEPEPSLVRSNGTVELNSEAAVHLRVAFVVHPRHSEMNESLGFHNTLHNGDVFGVGFEHGLKRFEDFLHRLVKFSLFGVSGYNFCIDCVTGAHRHTFSHPWCIATPLCSPFLMVAPNSSHRQEFTLWKNIAQNVQTVR